MRSLNYGAGGVLLLGYDIYVRLAKGTQLRTNAQVRRALLHLQ